MSDQEEEYHFDEDEEEFFYDEDTSDYAYMNENDHHGGDTEGKYEIENTFYEADDIKNTKPLEKVIELEKHKTEKEYYYKARIACILIGVKLEDISLIKDNISIFLQEIKHAPRTEANSCLNQCVDAVFKLNTPNHQDLNHIIDLLANHMQNIKEYRMLSRLFLKKARMEIDKGNYSAAQEIVQDLHAINEQHNSSSGSASNSNLLFDIRVLELSIAFDNKNMNLVRELYNDISNSKEMFISDSKTVATVSFAGACVLWADLNYSAAHSAFLKAFTQFQEAGQASNAMRALKYTVITGLLSGAKVNTLKSQEAAMYGKNEEVQAVAALHSAFEKCCPEKYQKVIDHIYQKLILGDEMIAVHVDELKQTFIIEVVARELPLFSVVRLVSLTELFGGLATVDEVELALVRISKEGWGSIPAGSVFIDGGEGTVSMCSWKRVPQGTLATAMLFENGDGDEGGNNIGVVHNEDVEFVRAGRQLIEQCCKV